MIWLVAYLIMQTWTVTAIMYSMKDFDKPGHLMSALMYSKKVGDKQILKVPIIRCNSKQICANHGQYKNYLH